MNRYNTSKAFRAALEKRLQAEIPNELWDVIVEFLFIGAIHEPYSDGDVDFSLPIVRKFLKLFGRSDEH